MEKFISHSQKDTFEFGKQLARTCCGGEVFALNGDLGAGKTCLSQGLAAGLKIKGPVNSPTFVIMKIYKVSGHKTINHFCHIDAYRITSADDLEAIGATDYLGRADTVSVIEWAGQVRGILPKKSIKIEIKHKNEDEREIKISLDKTAKKI
ncbi:MAG: tRNA (adenosine(37)-N6)-threonylcarbamoyltransferase complex ATPase subunit type 1 TsaE [Candidatus Falkowbacteria bacterium]